MASRILGEVRRGVGAYFPRFWRVGSGPRGGKSIGHSDESVSGSGEAITAYLRLDQIADVADGALECLDGSGFGFAQVRIDLGEACSIVLS